MFKKALLAIAALVSSSAVFASDYYPRGTFGASPIFSGKQNNSYYSIPVVTFYCPSEDDDTPILCIYEYIQIAHDRQTIIFDATISPVLAKQERVISLRGTIANVSPDYQGRTKVINICNKTKTDCRTVYVGKDKPLEIRRTSTDGGLTWSKTAVPELDKLLEKWGH